MFYFHYAGPGTCMPCQPPKSCNPRMPHISAPEHCSKMILIWNMHYLMLSEYPKIQFKMSTLAKVIQNKDFFPPTVRPCSSERKRFWNFFYRISGYTYGFFMTILCYTL
uniref:Uncharacterized protein n=1 Tax=Cacopsylla melanoneura TaxID=428564 RepID=A0A8D8ZGP2_9HEMI